MHPGLERLTEGGGLREREGDVSFRRSSPDLHCQILHTWARYAQQRLTQSLQ